jgi:hypothetical protein
MQSRRRSLFEDACQKRSTTFSRFLAPLYRNKPYGNTRILYSNSLPPRPRHSHCPQHQPHLQPHRHHSLYRPISPLLRQQKLHPHARSDGGPVLGLRRTRPPEHYGGRAGRAPNARHLAHRCQNLRAGSPHLSRSVALQRHWRVLWCCTSKGTGTEAREKYSNLALMWLILLQDWYFIRAIEMGLYASPDCRCCVCTQVTHC